jgi:hypothetical protein
MQEQALRVSMKDTTVHSKRYWHPFCYCNAILGACTVGIRIRPKQRGLERFTLQ